MPPDIPRKDVVSQQDKEQIIQLADFLSQNLNQLKLDKKYADLKNDTSNPHLSSDARYQASHKLVSKIVNDLENTLDDRLKDWCKSERFFKNKHRPIETLFKNEQYLQKVALTLKEIYENYPKIDCMKKDKLRKIVDDISTIEFQKKPPTLPQAGPH